MTGPVLLFFGVAIVAAAMLWLRTDKGKAARAESDRLKAERQELRARQKRR